MAWGTAFVDPRQRRRPRHRGRAGPHLPADRSRTRSSMGTYAQTNLLAENLGPGRTPLFRDATAEAGPGFEARLLEPRRGGRRLRQRRRPGPARRQPRRGRPTLLRNESAGGSWLTVVPEARTRAHRPDRHGRSRSRPADARVMRDVASGDSFLSTHDPRPHFGLGTADDGRRGGRALAGRHAHGAEGRARAPDADRAAGIRRRR